MHDFYKMTPEEKANLLCENSAGALLVAERGLNYILNNGRPSESFEKAHPVGPVAVFRDHCKDLIEENSQRSWRKRTRANSLDRH